MNFWTFQPTLNSVLMILIGVAAIAAGIAAAVLNPSGRVLGAGLFFTGAGTVIFGLTNGFTDMTPRGRNLFRLALVIYAIGFPALAYALYRAL